MDVKKPFVLGAGIMGAGIGQLCSQMGLEVVIADVSEEIIEKAKVKISKGLQRRIEKGKITEEEKESVISKLSWTTDMDLAAESDFVIEAISENLDLKRSVFKKLDNLCSENTIFTTNTTALSISEIAAATSRPDKVIGKVWFYDKDMVIFDPKGKVSDYSDFSGELGIKE